MDPVVISKILTSQKHSAASREPSGAQVYLSVAVLSSVGLSDITPAKPMARALVMLESFAGIMYVALVVSRLVNLTANARKDRPLS